MHQASLSKDNLCHLLAVGLGVQRGFGQKDGVLLWRYTELIIECMVPNLFHVIPVGHNAMLDRVL